MKFDKISNVRKLASDTLRIWKDGMHKKTLIQQHILTEALDHKVKPDESDPLDMLAHADDEDPLMVTASLSLHRPWFDASKSASPRSSKDARS